MKINYISTEDLGKTSGGWSGINSNLYAQLSDSFELNYIGPVYPKSFFREKLVSKYKRLIGLQGDFHFFSRRRLKMINNIVLKQRNENADYDFFFGQTPWINCKFGKPYGVYLDACFPTYLEIYSTPKHFDERDIARICSLEKQWLLNAEHLFFGSYWALHEAEKHYHCRFDDAKVIWVGGNIPVPEKDKYEGRLNYIFISLNFEKKGGYVCVEAFKKVREVYPEATLTIIGQKPSSTVLATEGVIYAGLFDKKDPKDFAKFISILEKASFLIHPTVMDTMGAVIIEAGYYGCPTIAPNSFGIPELIKNNITGFIVNTPFNAADFSKPLLEIATNRVKYQSFREEVRKYTVNNLTWEVVGNKVVESLFK